jgi:transcriptional regulator with XRE-family HTH domain
LLAGITVSTALPIPRDCRTLPGANIRRLMARLDMTLQEVVDATGLDERTLRSMVQGHTRPHARTLHRLASGLGVSTDELFQDPLSAGQAAFDRATNPAVGEVLDRVPEYFVGWNPRDFDELFSRMALGGELTSEGVLAAAATMNARREVLHQVAVLLETHEADLVREFIDLLYRRATQTQEP